MSSEGHLLKFVTGKRCVAMGADNTGHGLFLEYCNFIQLFMERNTVCIRHPMARCTISNDLLQMVTCFTGMAPLS